MNDRVEIFARQSAEELLKKYPGQFEVMKHPSGINFYTVRWPSEPYGKLIIGQPGHTVTLPYILSAKGNDDSYFPDEKINNWNINAGITVDNLIDHDEARRRFFGILQSIRQAGWKPIFLLSDPRLRGKDNLRYVLTESPVSYLDSEYMLNREEWMRVGNGSRWGFYADHAYLVVRLTRDRTRTDIDKPGAYFIEYSLTSENEEMRAYVGPDNRQSWKSVLPGQLAAAKEERKRIEAIWQAKGAHIDTQYQDPPIPNLSP